MFDFQQAERQMFAVGQAQYEIVKMRREAGASKNLYQADFRSIEDMRRKADAYANDTARGENLYIRAHKDADHEVIFLDDVHQQAIDFLAEQGVTPCCIVETSVKNGKASLHCWYRLSEPTDRATRKAIEYTLITRLHEKFPDPDPSKMPGDYGSCDGGHLGRLAGSWNYGLTKPKDNPVVLVQATGAVLSAEVTAHLLVAAEGNKKVLRKLDADLESIKVHEYENIKIIQWYKENAIPKMRKELPHFRQDFAAVCAMLRARFSTMDIKKVLWDFDPNPIQQRKVGHEAHYLACTLYNAQEAVGTPSPNPSPKNRRGADGAMPFAGACASAPTTYRLNPPAPQEPDTGNGSYTPPCVPGWGKTGRKMRGLINLETGVVTFGVGYVDEEPADEPAPTPTTRPSMLRHGIRPVRRPDSEFDISLDLCLGTGADPLDQMDNTLAGTIGPKP